MIKILTGDQIKDLDRHTIDGGVTSAELIGIAAQAIVSWISKKRDG